MQHSMNMCRALVLFGAFSAAASLPVFVKAQCTSRYELFVDSVPRTVNFAVRNPATGLVMAVEPQYAGAAAGRTWSWNGAAWQRVIDQGPLNVAPSMVTWDTARSRGVAVSRAGQTWEFDGASWSQVGSCPSTKCAGAAITYDAARGVTLLVSGGTTTDTAPVETWTWNGSTWTQIAAAGPANRHDAALVYDSARGVSVLFGGERYTTSPLPVWLGDLWEFNGTSWTQRTTGPGPGNTSAACAVYHAPAGGVVIYGGRAIGLHNQMWVWNGAAWSSIAALQPGQQVTANLVSDPSAGVLTLFGRIMPGNNNEFGKYGWQVFARHDGQAWTTVMKSNDYFPVSGDRSVMAYDSDRGVTVMFGGMMPTGDFFYESTTWEFNGQAWTRRDIPGSPTGRVFAAMAYDTARRRMVMTGGTTANNNAVAETWEYDGASWTLVSTDAAAGRRSHTMAYDPVRARMVMQGGHITGGTQRFDTQEWNGATWTQVAAAAPANLIPMVYDRTGQYMLGTANAPPSSSTLQLAPSGWTQILPSGFSGTRLEWYDAMQRVVGYSGPTRGTYRWTGSAWELIPVTFSPPGRGNFFSTAYDSRRDRLQIWGGSIDGPNSELWELVRPTADMGRAGGLSGPDGQLDNNDFIVFINGFFTESPRADVGVAGGLVGSDHQFDNNDFIAFIDLFFNGCGL